MGEGNTKLLSGDFSLNLDDNSLCNKIPRYANVVNAMFAQYIILEPSWKKKNGFAREANYVLQTSRTTFKLILFQT